MIAIDPALIHAERYSPDLATANPAPEHAGSPIPSRPASACTRKAVQGFDPAKAKVYYSSVNDKVAGLVARPSGSGTSPGSCGRRITPPQGQAEHEGRAAAVRLLEAQVAALRARQPPAEGEAEADAGALLAASRSDFENGRKSRRRSSFERPGPWSRTRTSARPPRARGGCRSRGGVEAAAYLQALSTRLTRICSSAERSTRAARLPAGCPRSRAPGPPRAARGSSRRDRVARRPREVDGLAHRRPRGRSRAARRRARSRRGGRAAPPRCAGARGTRRRFSSPVTMPSASMSV